MLRDPVTINLGRKAAPAVGITQAVYPVPQELKSALFLALLQRGELQEALVFTRTKHRADRVWKFLVRNGIEAERIHGNRSQPQRTQALAGFKSGKYRVLVATDIAQRGIDIEELGHVVNFDVPKVAEDYIHRVGRTARAEAVGDAFTFVAPDEEGGSAEHRAGDRQAAAEGDRSRLRLQARPEARLEVPLEERLVAMRAQKKLERARRDAKAARGAPAGKPGSPQTIRAPSAVGGVRHDRDHLGGPSRIGAHHHAVDGRGGHFRWGNSKDSRDVMRSGELLANEPGERCPHLIRLYCVGPFELVIRHVVPGFLQHRYDAPTEW